MDSRLLMMATLKTAVVDTVGRENDWVLRHRVDLNKVDRLSQAADRVTIAMLTYTLRDMKGKDST